MKKIIIMLFSLLSLISISASVIIPQKLLLEDMKPVLQKAKTYEKFKVIYNSDAHQLVDIAEAVNYFDLDDIEEIYEYLFE